jgi:formylmethanofuran dehydrogenase subunit E
LDFADAVKFHGHACPRLSVGYRVALLAANYFKNRSKDEELFWVREVEIESPEKAKVYPSITYSKCGEGFMEPLGRVRDRKIVCIPCFEAQNER